MTPSYAEFRSNRRFGSLDALRCISILLVIFSHTAAASMPRVESLHLGLAGVRLFFAISGFLITTLLLRERDATGAISLRNFVIRRTLRIFPLYYSILFCYVVLVLLTERHDAAGAQFFHNLPYFLTYTSNWFVHTDPAGGADRVLFLFAWSLATEEQFYLVWPSIEKFAGTARAGVVMIATVAGLIAFHLGLLDRIIPPTGFPHTFIESISLTICLGVLMAHALHSPRGHRVLGRIWTPLNSLIALALFSLCLIYSQSELLQSIAGALVVLSCVQSERHILADVLKWKPLVRIGAVSYGMYLMHLLCNHAIKVAAERAHVLDAGAGALVRFAATTVLAFVAATISFNYFESIFLKLKDRFEPKRGAGLSTATREAVATIEATTTA